MVGRLGGLSPDDRAAKAARRGCAAALTAADLEDGAELGNRREIGRPGLHGQAIGSG